METRLRETFAHLEQGELKSIVSFFIFNGGR